MEPNQQATGDSAASGCRTARRQKRTMQTDIPKTATAPALARPALVPGRAGRPSNDAAGRTAERLTTILAFAAEAAVVVAFACLTLEAARLTLTLWGAGELFRRYVEWALLPANDAATAAPALLRPGVATSALSLLAAAATGVVAALLAYSTAEGAGATAARLARRLRAAG